MLVIDRGLFEISVGGNLFLNCAPLLGRWNWPSLRRRNRDYLLLLVGQRWVFRLFILSGEVQGVLRFYETWTHHLLWVRVLKVGVHEVMENLVNSFLLRRDIQWLGSSWTLRAATPDNTVWVITLRFALSLFGSSVLCTKCRVSDGVWGLGALGRVCGVIDLF